MLNIMSTHMQSKRTFFNRQRIQDFKKDCFERSKSEPIIKIFNTKIEQ